MRSMYYSGCSNPPTTLPIRCLHMQIAENKLDFPDHIGSGIGRPSIANCNGLRIGLGMFPVAVCTVPNPTFLRSPITFAVTRILAAAHSIFACLISRADAGSSSR